MKMLYICSTEAGAGKTTVALALAQHWKGQGRPVGYFKPLGMGPADQDVALARELLGLSEPADAISPVAMGEAGEDSGTRIQAAAQQVSAGKDVVVVEGFSGLNQIGRGCEMARALGASVLLVTKYTREEGMDDDAAAVRRGAGQSFLGVVLNAIPASEDFRVRNTIAPAMDNRGIKMLGAIPQVRSLLCARVADLAEALGGTVEAGNRAEGELVESLMLSAPPYSDALSYMGRRSNKAVIAAAGRPDVQLAALETSTRALVVTGSSPIDPSVKARAGERGVAIIRVDCDTATALDRASSAFACARMAPGAQTAALVELAGQHMDTGAIGKALGI